MTPGDVDAWTRAQLLYEHVSRGGVPEAIPTSLRLGHGENLFVDSRVGYARFAAADAQAQQLSMGFWGSPAWVIGGLAVTEMINKSSREAAALRSSPQWRGFFDVRVVLTDVRLLFEFQGNWETLLHEDAFELGGDVAQWSLEVRYRQSPPLLMYGMAAPWIAVALAAVLYGSRAPVLDVLSPLRPSADAGGDPRVHGQAAPPRDLTPGASGAGAEVMYDTGSWTDLQFDQVRSQLDRRQVSWYLEADELVVDKSAELIADQIIAGVVGETPIPAEQPRPEPDVQGRRPSSPWPPPFG